ncbi:transposase [Colletotrichum chrysophilum]|uniref:Transposase n=1 Tax=Colletotrichum chrysophilum TaxID=1836956 RepID=A0AAD9ECJ7_9PEZI|nr:transposase [Colletotrichum chrysophilum]
MMAKYGINNEDLYNFDETGFMMGVITGSMVVTRADRHGKAKSVQPGNREWATVIECINSRGWCIPPFVIVRGSYHLANWSTESGFPGDWVIKPTTNGWNDNETGLDWIKHFEKHTRAHAKGVYRMLIIDGHESHLSAEFDEYCKQNNIITVSMPPHSSHLLQPLDIALYSPLKRAYGDEINLFIKSSVNHITKSEFFVAFYKAHNKIFTNENIKSAFRGAGILPWDPNHVIGKLNVYIRTPTPPATDPSTPPAWQSQTPSNRHEALSQSNFIKTRISAHQGSSPTPIIEAVDRLAKGAQAMAHSITILTDQVRTLQDANVALAKRRRAKKTRVQLGGALSIAESQVILEEKGKGKCPAPQEGEDGGLSKKGRSAQRRCGVCGKTGHNARTCSKDVESSSESDADES